VMITLGSLSKEYAASFLKPEIVADTSVSLSTGVIFRLCGASLVETILSLPSMSITHAGANDVADGVEILVEVDRDVGAHEERVRLRGVDHVVVHDNGFWARVSDLVWAETLPTARAASRSGAAGHAERERIEWKVFIG